MSETPITVDVPAELEEAAQVSQSMLMVDLSALPAGTTVTVTVQIAPAPAPPALTPPARHMGQRPINGV